MTIINLVFFLVKEHWYFEVKIGKRVMVSLSEANDEDRYSYTNKSNISVI